MQYKYVNNIQIKLLEAFLQIWIYKLKTQINKRAQYTQVLGGDFIKIHINFEFSLWNTFP